MLGADTSLYVANVVTWTAAYGSTHPYVSAAVFSAPLVQHVYVWEAVCYECMLAMLPLWTQVLQNTCIDVCVMHCTV